MISQNGLSSVAGFQFAGLSLGGQKRNLGLVYATEPDTIGTAVYTRSDVVAAPVIVSQKMDQLGHGKRAVLINSGIANAFTGKQGLIDAEACINKVASYLGIAASQCYIGSTGVIGKKLNSEVIQGQLQTLVDSLTPDADLDFVEAIMTTDTRPKQASVSFQLNGKTVTIAACAKGSGMIMPNMATMLSVVLTDAAISFELLQQALRDAVADTFNCISVDGDTSTNDSVFLLANGLAGNDRIETAGNDYQTFYQHLQQLLEHMAKEIVNDGEGITKFITIDVLGTPERAKARAVAFSIANSPLVKTAFYGEDLNWGRILMAIGKAMTGMDCSILDIYINRYLVVKQGEPQLNEEEYQKAKQSLKNHAIDIVIDFNQGAQGIRVWTCDFSLEYVKINAHYTT